MDICEKVSICLDFGGGDFKFFESLDGCSTCIVPRIPARCIMGGRAF